MWFLSFILQAWDDVVRKVKPAEKPFDYARDKPLDQEKSSLSLAEIYEQEFLKQTQVHTTSCTSCTSWTIVSLTSRVNQKKRKIKGM